MPKYDAEQESYRSLVNGWCDFCQIYNFGEVPNAFNSVIFHEAPFASTLTTRKKLAENMAAKFVDSWLTAGT
jgi:hypothetical protein